MQINKKEARAVIVKFIEAESAFWGLVGIFNDIPHSGFDFIEGEWSLNGMREVNWIEDGDLYSAEIYGTSVWKGEHYTIVVCRPNIDKYSMIFDNDMRRACLEEDDDD